jgi:hypothetical protein
VSLELSLELEQLGRQVEDSRNTVIESHRDLLDSLDAANGRVR